LAALDEIAEASVLESAECLLDVVDARLRMLWYAASSFSCSRISISISDSL